MNTFLLLAGRSTRFWPLSEKTLFPVLGKTLLEHQIERLQSAGCTNIILVGGEHNLEEASQIAPDLPTVEQEDLTLGMRGALLSILKQYGNDPLMIVSGNDVIEPEAYKNLLDSSGDGAILGYRVEEYFPGGYLTLDGDRITGIAEKPGEGNEPSDVVNIVAHVHRDPEALSAALEDVDTSRDDGYEQALDKLFADQTYTAVPYDGFWQAVKFPWHLQMLATGLLEQLDGQSIADSAEVHPSAEIIGNVIIDDDVRVLPNAVIRGPAYIGKRTIVANNALVRGSSVGDDCVVGYCTEVKGSVLHSNVWTHMNYLGDSVIGNNVSFGAGTVTGNFRLDEAIVESVVKEEKLTTGLQKFGAVIGNNCRFGTHISTSPGVKIGSGTFVTPHVFIAEDIPEKSFVRMKDGVVKISENKTDVGREETRNELRKKL